MREEGGGDSHVIPADTREEIQAQLLRVVIECILQRFGLEPVRDVQIPRR